MKTPWLPYLNNLLPSWLQSAQYPFSGVGDLQDLKYNPVVSQGEWSGIINPGWFYFNNKEQYNYILRGIVSVQSSGSAAQLLTESISFRPSWGPILITSSLASGYSYTQHSNSLVPGKSMTWTQIGSSGYYYTIVPTGCIVCGARNLTNTMLGQVSSSGEILNENFYAYNLDGIVYVKPTSTPIQIFLDLLYFTPQVKMYELVVQSQGKLVPSYNYPNLSQFTVSKGYASSVVGNVTGSVINPLSGYDGDWFVLSYYIDYSFVVQDHKTIQYWTNSTGGDQFYVSWEQSIPNIRQSVSLSTSPTGTFNVNPIYPDSFRAGYLFHARPASSVVTYWTPDILRVNVDKSTVIHDSNEYVKVSLLLLGDNELPIPWYPLTISYSAGATAIVSSQAITDGRGEWHGLFAVPIGLFTFSASAGILTALASATSINLSTRITSDLVRKAFINLYVSPSSTSQSANTCYASITNIDGVPLNTNLVSGDVSQITVSSLLSSEFINGFGTSGVSITDQAIDLNLVQDYTNPIGVIEFGYSPQQNDKLVANFDTAQSIILPINI